MNFKDRLLDALTRLLTSVKSITTLAGFICYLAAKKGIVLSPDDVQGVLILFATLLGAQGLHDIGKGKAQVEAANPKSPDKVEQTVNVDTAQPPQGSNQ